MQARSGGEDDVIQVALPFAVAEHGIKSQLLENQIALAISAADDAGHRFGDGVRGGLEFRPTVDPVCISSKSRFRLPDFILLVLLMPGTAHNFFPTLRTLYSILSYKHGGRYTFYCRKLIIIYKNA
jgi:hypothetical protein